MLTVMSNSLLAPSLLVAAPQLVDPNFVQSVVLMMEHSSEGAVGLVLNRPSPLTLAEVGKSQTMPVHDSLARSQVFVGGPVAPERGFVIHTQPGLAQSMNLFGEIQISSSMDALRSMLLDETAAWRLCLGYAGWGAGQLEHELQEGAWLVAPATAAHVLGTSAELLWETVLRDMGIDPHRLVHARGLH